MSVPNRCRLVIVLPAELDNAETRISAALAGGDVAGVIVASAEKEYAGFQSLCEAVVPVIQQAGAAVIIANDTRVAGRCGADGIHLDFPGGDVGVTELREAIDQFAPAKIVGAGAVKTRHMALSLGEAGPDYVFFGSLSGDIKPPANPKMLALAEWWAQMVEIPGICLGGNLPESVVEVAATGIDFVALSSAIFSDKNEAGEVVRQVNLLLDEKAPQFVDD